MTELMGKRLRAPPRSSDGAALAGEFDVVEVQSEHDDMFDEPQVECVTAELAAVCEVAARIRTNNPLEFILREIRWRTRVVGAFPDGLRHIAGTAWSRKRYPNIETALKARDAQV